MANEKRWRWIVLCGSVLACVACEKDLPVATRVKAPREPAAAKVPVAVRTIEFDVALQTSALGRSWERRMHVLRRRAGTSWQTTLLLPLDDKLAKMPGHDKVVQRLEVDADGNVRAFAGDGSEHPTPTGVHPALDSMTFKNLTPDIRAQTVTAIGAAKAAAHRPRLRMDWIDAAFAASGVRGAEAAAARSGAVEESSALSHASVRSFRRANLRATIDTARQAVTSIEMFDKGQLRARVEYDYVDGPENVSIRRSMYRSWIAPDGTSRSSTMTLSSIHVDGLEVKP